MDDYKLKLNAAVAARLSAAPASAEKDELIEELSDNLYRRFLDMTGAGVPDGEAFQRSLDDLGDVDELLSYLGVEPGGDVTIDRQEGRTRITTKDGQHIVINGADDENIIINTGSAGEPGASPEKSGDASEDGVHSGRQPQGSADARGGVHYDRSGEIPQSDLDAILAGVSEVCNSAIDQAKEALRQAKEAIQRRTTVQRDSGRVSVHFNAGPIPPEPPEPAEPTDPADPPEPPEPPVPPAGEGWEFEAELDSDEGRFFAGAGPKQRKDVAYGFGYDKARGGFYAQWGEWRGVPQDKGPDSHGPHFYGEGSYMEHQDDGSYSVTALRDLRGIEVFTTSGDVSIHVSEAPDAGVIIDGDVDELDVTCSADGVLTIREGRTASSSFFSRRGLCSADVELYLPRRHWETIVVSTTSGDVDIDRDGLDIDQLSVSTTSGDLSCCLRACSRLAFKASSGDLDLSGSCAELHAETASGDISLRGHIGSAYLKTVSGDIQQDGPVERFLGSSMSGDVEVETSQLPQLMQLSSKSGDCLARIPDAGPFTLRMKTVSGETDCGFHANYVNGVFIYGDGSGPSYSMTTISGDVTLERC